MIQQILQKTAATLQDIFLAGCASAYQHPELSQHIEAISPLAVKVPAFERLRQELQTLHQNSSQENATILIRTQSLIAAMMYTQTKTSTASPTQRLQNTVCIDLSQHLKPFTWNDLSPIRQMEEESLYKKTATLDKRTDLTEEALEKQLFQDWRSFPTLRLILGKYQNRQNNIQSALSQGGDCFKHFYYQSPILKETIGAHIHSLLQVSDPQALIWGQTVLADPELSAYKDNLTRAVQTLGLSAAHESQALEYTKHKKKDVRCSAYKALIQMQSPHIRTLLFQRLFSSTDTSEIFVIDELFRQINQGLSPSEKETVIHAIQTQWAQVERGEKLSKTATDNNSTLLFRINHLLGALAKTPHPQLIPTLEEMVQESVIHPNYVYTYKIPPRIMEWFLSDRTLAFEHLPTFLATVSGYNFLIDIAEVLSDNECHIISLTENEIFSLLGSYVQSFDWNLDNISYLDTLLRILTKRDLLTPWLPYIQTLLDEHIHQNPKLASSMIDTCIYWLKPKHPHRSFIDGKYLEFIEKNHYFPSDFYSFNPYEYYIFKPNNPTSLDFQQQQQQFIKVLRQHFLSVVERMEQLENTPFSHQHKQWDAIHKQLYFVRRALQETHEKQPSQVAESLPQNIHTTFCDSLQTFAQQLLKIEISRMANASLKKEEPYLEQIRHISHLIFSQPLFFGSNDDFLNSLLLRTAEWGAILENERTSAKPRHTQPMKHFLEIRVYCLQDAFQHIISQKISVPVHFTETLSSHLQPVRSLLNHFKTVDPATQMSILELLQTIETAVPAVAQPT